MGHTYTQHVLERANTKHFFLFVSWLYSCLYSHFKINFVLSVYPFAVFFARPYRICNWCAGAHAQSYYI